MLKKIKTNEERNHLLSTITSLSKVAESYDVPLKVPKLFVTGSQSKGKSSLVDGMSGVTFNFCGNGIASRFPINFTMINSPQHTTPNWTVIDKKTKCPNLTTMDVSTRVANRNIALAHKNTVSPQPMELELRWDSCPNLSFMDLPGLRAFAADEEERKLQKQIDQMVKDIIAKYSKSSNVYFLVVEDAKEDVANYHGLAKIQKMLNEVNGKSKIEEKIEDDIPDMDEDDFEFVKEEPIPVYENEGPNRFFLVLNKFDNFIKSKDLSVEDKTKKLEDVISKFQTKGIPLFFTSLPNSNEKASFEAIAEHEDDSFKKQIILAEAFANSLAEHQDADNEAIGELLEGYNGSVGFLSLKKFVENMMMQEYRQSLPQIRSKLISKQTELLQAAGLGDSNVKQYLQQKLPTTCAQFKNFIENFLSADTEKVPFVPEHLTLEEEYALLPEDSGSFSYTKAIVWRNQKYNERIRKILKCDCKVFGGAQIRRLIREFILCVLCLNSSIDDDDFYSKVVGYRDAMDRHIASQQMSWETIISRILRESSKQLLGEDILFFSKRLQGIMKSWFEPAWLASIQNSESEIPYHIKDELESQFMTLVKKWCEKMENRLIEFAVYSIRDYNARSFKQKLTSRPGISDTVFSPSASNTFENIIRILDPGESVDLSASKLLESKLMESMNNADRMKNDFTFLRLTEDETVTDEVIEKIRTICSIQIYLGSERISDSFQFIFETMFKDPLCQKLGPKLVSWSSLLPQILEDRLREDNLMLQDIEKHINLISEVMGKSF